MPYAPGAKVVEIVKRIHEGLVPQKLTETALISLGIAEGNAVRVHKALRFLRLITPESDQTDEAVKLRRATSDEYEPVLSEIVKGAYEPVFQLYDPATANGIDLNNAFKPYDPAGQRPQMIALFMALSREAGLAPQDGVRKRGRPPASATTRPKVQRDLRERAAERPSTLGGENGARKGSTTRTVALRDGSSGSVSVSVSADLWELDGENRDFVFFLLDVVKAWERGESGAIWCRNIDISA